MQHVTALSAGNFFTITVDSGASGEFNIPTSGLGYDYDVNTSDGQNITNNTGTLNLIFPDTDTIYTINISGSFPSISISGVSPNDTKLLSIENFGIYGISSTTQSNSFRGCSNLIINAVDIGNFENNTIFIRTWRYCSSLTSFPLLNVSSGTSFSQTWGDCSSLTSFPLLNVSSGTDFSQAWYDCSSLTSFPLLDVSSGTSFSETWERCSLITTFPLLDVSSGLDFSLAWFNCTSLTTFPSNFFDNCLATNLVSAFNNTALTQTSIDNILVSIESNTTSNGTFNQSGGSAPSATGEAAITDMRSRGWTITVTGGF